jgi:hypothetical protein
MALVLTKPDLGSKDGGDLFQREHSLVGAATLKATPQGKVWLFRQI